MEDYADKIDFDKTGIDKSSFSQRKFPISKEVLLAFIQKLEDLIGNEEDESEKQSPFKIKENGEKKSRTIKDENVNKPSDKQTNQAVNKRKIKNLSFS